MKIILTIATGFILIAIIGVYFFDIKGDFQFVAFFKLIWQHIDNFSKLLEHVFEWFKTLINWIQPEIIMV